MQRKNKNIKILHVIRSLELAGAETVVDQLVRNVQDQSVQQDVYCLVKKDLLGERLERDGYRVFAGGKKEGKDFSLYWKLFFRMLQGRYDLIHCHNENPVIYAVPPAKLLGLPVVLTLHGSGDYFGKNLSVLKPYSPFIEKIVAVSDKGANKLISFGIPQSKVLTIHNGVSLPTFHEPELFPEELPSQESGVFVVGVVGNLTPVKNQIFLLKVFHEFLNKNPGIEAKMFILGEGSERTGLETYVKQNMLEDRVYLMGRRENPRSYMRRFDLLMSSSHSEGISIAFLEVMSLGVPVLASRVGGNPELIEDGKNGRLFALDAPDALQRVAEMLTTLCLNPQRRKEVGCAAALTVKDHFNLKDTTHAYEELYGNFAHHKSMRKGASNENTTYS